MSLPRRVWGRSRANALSMGTYLIRRVILMVPTLLGVTLLVFLLLAATPGGIGGKLKATADDPEAGGAVQAARHAYFNDRYGLSDPVLVQYGRWLAAALPIKFGQRDQFKPDGDIVRAPRTVEAHPLLRWAAEAAPAPREPASGEPTGAAAGAAPYSAAEMAAGAARAAARLNALRLDRAFAAYAEATGWKGAIGRDGRARAGALAGTSPNRDHPAWPAVAAAARAAADAHATAESSRETLLDAIASEPFPKSGVPVIPGILWLGWPDLGTSLSFRRPVIAVMRERLGVTLTLNLISTLVVYFVAMPLGVLAAVRRGGWLDRLSTLMLVSPVPRLIGFMSAIQK